MLSLKPLRVVATASLLTAGYAIALTPSGAAFSLIEKYEHYYVGIDGRQTIATGTYAGLANPNYQRLTFLFPHLEPDPTSNHFHGLGAYSYEGDPASPTVVSTSTNNRIPEPWTNLPALDLLPGTGVFSDRRISSRTENEYSNLKIGSIKSLEADLGEPAINNLYNSSEGRWTGSLGNAQIGWQLVSITPGLGVADAQGNDLFSGVGDTYALGTGDSIDFTPIFYTSKSAPLGNYSATFRLVDLGTGEGYTPVLESGTFSYDFKAVPEPLTILGTSAAFAMGMGLKKRFGKKAS